MTNASKSSESRSLTNSQENLTGDSTSSFSIFLTSSSSSIRESFPQRKGVFQINASSQKQNRNRILNPSYANKKVQNNNILDIIYDDTLLRTPETKSFLNDQYCIQNRKFLFEKLDFTIFQDDELNKLLCHLREYSVYSAINREYSEAKKSDALFDKIQFELMQRSIPSMKKVNKLEYLFEQQRKEEMIKLDNELIQFDEETDNKRTQLLNKQIDDLNDFETKWRKEKPPKYRKPSSKLLHLLASEKRLARIGKYDEAESYKEESAKLIEFERNQAQSLLFRDYKIAKEKFIKKQEEELTNLIESRQQQRDLIMAKRMGIEETFQKRESIILDRKAQVPKTKNSDESLAENQNFIGNEWLKYGTGGNKAKVLYDDHITFENPIPPLIPPNELETNQKDNINIKNQEQNKIMKISQKRTNRLNSVGHNLRKESNIHNREHSSNEKQKYTSRENPSKETSRISSSMKSSESNKNFPKNVNNISKSNSAQSPRNSIKARSIQNKPIMTSSSSKNSIKNIFSNKNNLQNRSSSSSKNSLLRRSTSSKQSNQDSNAENSLNKKINNSIQKLANFSARKEQIPSQKSTDSGIDNKSQTKLNQSNIKPNTKFSDGLLKDFDSGSLSSNQYETKKSSIGNKEHILNSKTININNHESDSSIVSASDEFIESNSN